MSFLINLIVFFFSTSAATNTNATYPALFWNLHPNWNNTEQGISYARSNPASWRNLADSSPLRGYYAAPKEDINRTVPVEHTRTSNNILDLSYRPRISHGPRRRRRHSISGRNSSKCRGLAINCAWNRNHICCLEGSAEGQGQAIFQDPEFGIPLDQPPPSYNSRTTITANAIGETSRKEDNKELTKRRWTIGSTLIPAIPYAPNYKCPVDCRSSPGHPCCAPVDRFAPIGPYVQPTLLENWVTSLFIMFGNDPTVYLIAKKLILVAMFFFAFMLWGWLGRHFGWLEIHNPFSARIDGIDDLTNDVISAVDGQAWLNELSSREAVKGGSAINRFVCCFKEEDAGGESDRGIRCFQRPPKKRRGHDHEEMSVLDCVSKLAYEVTMNATQNKV